MQRYGLECLIDSWFFCEDGEQYSCDIVEVRPDFAKYRISDHGHPQVFTIRESHRPEGDLVWSRKDRA